MLGFVENSVYISFHKNYEEQQQFFFVYIDFIVEYNIVESRSGPQANNVQTNLKPISQEALHSTLVQHIDRTHLLC